MRAGLRRAGEGSGGGRRFTAKHAPQSTCRAQGGGRGRGDVQMMHCAVVRSFRLPHTEYMFYGALADLPRFSHPG